MTVQANKHAEQADPTSLGVKYLTVDSTTATDIKPYEQVVVCTVTASRTLYLPPLAEAAGKIYSFHWKSGTSGTVTIDARDEATITDTLTTAGHMAVFYCTGFAWVTLFSST